MTCKEIQPLLADYAAGAATAAERALIEEHLAGARHACHDELAELQEAAALLIDAPGLDGTSLPALPPGLKARVLDAITAPATPTSPAPKRSRWTVAAWAVAASLALTAAGVTWLRSPEAADSVTTAITEAWRGRISQSERDFAIRGARLVMLPLDRFQNSVVTHVLYDSVSQQLHVWAAHNPLASRTEPNRAWLIDDKGLVVARGPLRQASLGRLVALLDVAGLKSPTAKVLLTVEPDGSAATPSDGSAATPSDDIIEQGILEIR
jgi:hypothetical protein